MEDTARTGAVTTEHPALRHVSLSLFRVTRLLHIRSATLPAALSHQTFERSGRFRGMRGGEGTLNGAATVAIVVWESRTGLTL
jgi:hypothetical protein